VARAKTRQPARAKAASFSVDFAGKGGLAIGNADGARAGLDSAQRQHHHPGVGQTMRHRHEGDADAGGDQVQHLLIVHRMGRRRRTVTDRQIEALGIGAIGPVNDRLPLQLLRGDRLAAGQRMVAVKRHAEAFGQDRQKAMIGRHASGRGIAQIADLGQLGETELQMRLGPPQPMQRRGEAAQQDVRTAIDADRLPRPASEPRLKTAQPRHAVARLAIKLFAQGRRGQPRFRSQEQRFAQLRLKLLDGGRDGGLADPAGLGRAAEGAALVGAEEIAKRGQLYHSQQLYYPEIDQSNPMA